MSIEDTREIAADSATVWSLTLDVENWPALTSTITSVERLDDGPLRVGSQARIKQPGQRPRVWTVSRLDPPHAFEWFTTIGPLRMTGAHAIRPTPNGCENTLSIRLEGWGRRVAEALLGRALRRTITTENHGFVVASEAATAR